MDKNKEVNRKASKIDLLVFMSPEIIMPIDRSSYKIIDFIRNLLNCLKLFIT